MMACRTRPGIPVFEMIALPLAILAMAAAFGLTRKTLDAAASPVVLPKVPVSWSGAWGRSFAPLPPASVTQRPRLITALAKWPPSQSVRSPKPLVPKDDATPREPRRVRVEMEDGRVVVARVHGGEGSRVVLLPDGSLGWPNGMAFTEEPFRPLTADQLVEALQNGPYRHFGLIRTEHYLVFHTSSPEFARQSSQLLESLYKGVVRKFRDLDLPVHDAEFPLVAVVFRNETEFRERREVAKDVQAYYEVLSNQIFLYETRDRDLEAPRVAAMRKPQTLAHEGTHQILMNIGVQARLARWPAWLTEGLAEYCAPTTTKGRDWAGFAQLNPFHVSTLHELEDTLALQGRAARLIRNQVGHAPGRCTVLELSKLDELTPTDYALAWGLTYYLATKRSDEFVSYLRLMSTMKPLAPDSRSFAETMFRRAFGDDMLAMGLPLRRHIATLPRPEPMPYYAVIFEQDLGDGVVRRGTMVSQSPMVIRQWLDSMAEGFDAPWAWYPYSCPTRAAAFATAETWIRSR
jgi:Protein of unknown function (DUF1570)